MPKKVCVFNSFLEGVNIDVLTHQHILQILKNEHFPDVSIYDMHKVYVRDIFYIRSDHETFFQDVFEILKTVYCRIPRKIPKKICYRSSSIQYIEQPFRLTSKVVRTSNTKHNDL